MENKSAIFDCTREELVATNSCTSPSSTVTSEMAVFVIFNISFRKLLLGVAFDGQIQHLFLWSHSIVDGSKIAN